MEKKFKVKVEHFAENKYRVKYCSYYIIPLHWKALQYFFRASAHSGLASWNDNLFLINDAEHIAKGINSLEDVVAYEEEGFRRQKEHEEKKERAKLETPYYSKTFKK